MAPGLKSQVGYICARMGRYQWTPHPVTLKCHCGLAAYSSLTWISSPLSASSPPSQVSDSLLRTWAWEQQHHVPSRDGLLHLRNTQIAPPLDPSPPGPVFQLNPWGKASRCNLRVGESLGKLDAGQSVSGGRGLAETSLKGTRLRSCPMSLGEKQCKEQKGPTRVSSHPAPHLGISPSPFRSLLQCTSSRKLSLTPRGGWATCSSLSLPSFCPGLGEQKSTGHKGCR